MHTEDNNTGKGNPGGPKATPHHEPAVDQEHPGYETSDANVKGVAVFLAGLFGTVIIFFFFCYGLGKVINNLWEKQDGVATKWTAEAGNVPLGKGKDLASNPEIEQQQLARITSNFPQPRLETDDGEQETADLHAREDLLLNYYSTVDGKPGTIRIPIERAMQLIAQQGLPVENQTGTPDNVAHAAPPQIRIPLTTGFARTGFELTTIEAREQKLAYGKAESAQAEPPAK